MKLAMKLWMLRHGKTAGNLEKRYVGSTDEMLCEQGKEELLLRKEQLLADCGVPTHIFVSPMLRCRQTAELLFPACEQIAIDGLRECDFGAFEYKNYAELNGNADYQRYIDSGGRVGFPGGESLECFRERTVKAFEKIIIDSDSDTTVGLVVHGGTIMALCDAFSVPHQDYFSWQVANGQGLCCDLVRMENGKLAFLNIKQIGGTTCL